MKEEIFSRPARLGALITGDSEESVVHLFTKKRILVRLEAPFSQVPDARETFLFAVNQCLRFCSNISVLVAAGRGELTRACEDRDFPRLAVGDDKFERMGSSGSYGWLDGPKAGLDT